MYMLNGNSTPSEDKNIPSSVNFWKKIFHKINNEMTTQFISVDETVDKRKNSKQETGVIAAAVGDS